MNGELGAQYLASYRIKTDPLLTNFLRKKINQAAAIDGLSKTLVQKFEKMTKLGKRLRGALVVLGYQSSGGKDIRAILDTSLFVELFHTGALVLDDLMDQDETRRGLPSIHKQFEAEGRKWKIRSSSALYGRSMAMNVGNLAFYLSWEKLMQGNFPAKDLIKAGSLYVKFVTRLIYGQSLDITKRKNTINPKSAILKTIRHKTAEYTGVMPLLIGATLAGLKDQRKKKALEKYGLSLGMAMQLRDDILGIYGKEKEIGKPVGSDLREGKQTMLVYHLFRYGTGKQRAITRNLLGKRALTKEDVRQMKKLLKDSGTLKYVTDLGWDYVDQGKKVIPEVSGDPETKALLESLIMLMMERTK
ncbi:MAG: hypothetical protein A2900_01725 [Candidatus Chisholmbacteria bacterium RIFCSPLOWO2_01_FULL_50_28]|uniref:Polyprenyl synthetase n=1 Tax=Candidatus Chisholmbacteria bacterium RIFCSPHIGHO2_01_FULL_52_32 TaxID=1797591 RepID=A0A1G1VTU6_9BACT|nr:MAG: hypothetical protein A2786_05020 [Candidatus Chisholmbacteria bacterium RIFCSPHIGHO2_01_FULL_52_32]OGY19805.1 MAG: hypothetical protein A2900_01725 [Candidatus Chisholmbacteria bacterium RIFCSPLOWO2_01_FULL_50_28]